MYTTKYRNWATPGYRSNVFLNDFITREFLGGGIKGGTVPSSNVKETKDNFTIELAAPGFEKGDFKISLEDKLLVISSEKKNEQVNEGERYTKKEFGVGAFSRSYKLPETVNTESIVAAYDKGILSVVLPKKVEVEKSSKQIEIV